MPHRNCKNRNYRSWLWGVFSLMSIIGCNVSNKYQTPKFDLGDTYRSSDSSQVFVDSGALAAMGWRTFFQDSLLTNLIDTALVKNFDLRAAVKNIDIADQMYRQSKAQLLPSVSANMPNFYRNYRSPNTPDAPKDKYYQGQSTPKNLYISDQAYSAGLQASWEPDIWGKIRGMNAVAQKNYLETAEMKNAVQTRLIASLAQAYYNLLALDEQIKVARLNRSLTDTTLRIIRLLRSAGEETSLAIEQTQALNQVAEALVPELERQISIQENYIRFLMGDLPNAIPRDTALVDSFFHEDIKVAYPMEVVHNRPDVRRAELNLVRANDSVGVTQKYRYPSLILSGQFGLNSVLAKNWFDIPGSLFGSIIGSVTTSIFNNRRIKTNIEVAKLNRDKAEISFQRTVYNAMQEISNTIINIQKLHQQIEIANRQVATASLAVKHAFLLFKSGYEETNYLQVITAQQSLLNTQMQLVSLNVDYVNERIQLYRDLGGGWK